MFCLCTLGASVGFLANRSDNFYTYFLGEENPGVEIVIVRDSRNAAPRTVWCKRSQDQADLAALMNPLPPGENKKEKVYLRFGKDESHDKGGIADPKIGLSVIRNGETDRPWTYSGEIKSATAHSHTLTFTRPVATQAHATS
jgi:hypothetical protein